MSTSTSTPTKDPKPKKSEKENTTKSFVEEDQDINATAYIAQMNSKEKIAYQIAKDHLGTSFNLKKSIGYKEWLKIKERSQL